MQSDLKKLSVIELKKKCKESGLKGYSKLKKVELVQLLKKSQSKQETKKFAPKLDKLTVADLKKKCKEKGIKGFSKMKKNQLLKLLYPEDVPVKNPEQKFPIIKGFIKSLFKSHKSQDEKIAQIIKFDAKKDEHFFQKILQNENLLYNYVQLENYFYKNGELPNLKGDIHSQIKMIQNYYKKNNLDENLPLDENKKLIPKTNKMDFSKLYLTNVPYYTKYSTMENFKNKLSEFLGKVHVTTHYRFPFEWMMEQLDYINKLKNSCPNDKELILYYTGNGYRQINTYLSSKKVPTMLNYRIKNNLRDIYKKLYRKTATDDELRKKLKTLYPIMLKRLNEIIKNSPPLPHDILVFKGIKSKYNANRKSFISTSLSLSVANNFQNYSCCKTYFILKKGLSALAILFISNLNEYEILLPYDIKQTLLEKDSKHVNSKIQKSKEIDIYEITR